MSGRRAGNTALLVTVTGIASICLILSLRMFVSDTDLNVHAAVHSLKPAGSLPLTIDHKSVVFFVYTSRYSDENSYSLSLPKKWIIRPKGMRAGAYIILSPMVKGTVELMKIPHGFSLGDYILMAEEPEMRETIPEYEREDFHRVSVRDSTAYRLAYTSRHNGTSFFTMRTYISGSEATCVITLLCRKEDRDEAMPLLTAAVSNFRWEDK
jgi:hypothetical protein